VHFFLDTLRLESEYILRKRRDAGVAYFFLRKKSMRYIFVMVTGIFRAKRRKILIILERKNIVYSMFSSEILQLSHTDTLGNLGEDTRFLKNLPLQAFRDSDIFSRLKCPSRKHEKSAFFILQ